MITFRMAERWINVRRHELTGVKALLVHDTIDYGTARAPATVLLLKDALRRKFGEDVPDAELYARGLSVAIARSPDEELVWGAVDVRNSAHRRDAALLNVASIMSGSSGLLHTGPVRSSQAPLEVHKVAVGLGQRGRHSHVRGIWGGTPWQRKCMRQSLRAKREVAKLGATSTSLHKVAQAAIAANGDVAATPQVNEANAAHAEFEAVKGRLTRVLNYKPRPRKTCATCGEARFRTGFVPSQWRLPTSTCRSCQERAKVPSSYDCAGCGVSVPRNTVHARAKTCETCATSWTCTKCEVVKAKEEFSSFYWDGRLARSAAGKSVPCLACTTSGMIE